jgi:hypothetical protein
MGIAFVPRGSDHFKLSEFRRSLIRLKSMVMRIHTRTVRAIA